MGKIVSKMRENRLVLDRFPANGSNRDMFKFWRRFDPNYQLENEQPKPTPRRWLFVHCTRHCGQIFNAGFPAAVCVPQAANILWEGLHT